MILFFSLSYCWAFRGVIYFHYLFSYLSRHLSGFRKKNMFVSIANMPRRVFGAPRAAQVVVYLFSHHYSHARIRIYRHKLLLPAF